MPRRSEPRTRVTPGTYDWFQQEVGRFFYRAVPKVFDAGPNPATWSATHREMAHQVIQQGEHEVYHAAGHDWTFLSPELVLPLVSGQEDYEMAEDFGGVLGSRMMFTSTDSAYDDVIKTDPRVIRDRRSYNTDVSSYPSMFAEEIKPHDGQTQQLYHIMVWPTPDGSYTLKGKYRVHPVYMSESRQYPYGGPALQQVLLQGMKAIVEQDYLGGPGIQTQRYQERLQEAVLRDGRNHGAAVLGYNGNGRRSGLGLRDGLRYENYTDVTYGGSFYSG